MQACSHPGHVSFLLSSGNVMIRDYNHTRVPVVFHKETLEFTQLLGLNLKQLLAHVVMTEQNSWISTPAQQMNTAKCVSLSTQNILGESEKKFPSYQLLFIIY